MSAVGHSCDKRARVDGWHHADLHRAYERLAEAYVRLLMRAARAAPRSLYLETERDLDEGLVDG